MAENKVVGSLVLRTFDINPATVPVAINNEYGIISANTQYVTFKNVNMKLACGSLYDKYKRFNLKLTSAQYTQNVAMNYGHFAVFISGLNFTSNYSTRYNINSQVCLGCVNFQGTAGAGVTSSLMSGLVTFDKPSFELVDITVEFKNSTGFIVDNINEKSNSVLGNWTLVMDIYGIDD